MSVKTIVKILSGDEIKARRLDRINTLKKPTSTPCALVTVSKCDSRGAEAVPSGHALTVEPTVSKCEPTVEPTVSKCEPTVSKCEPTVSKCEPTVEPTVEPTIEPTSTPCALVTELPFDADSIIKSLVNRQPSYRPLIGSREPVKIIVPKIIIPKNTFDFFN